MDSTSTINPQTGEDRSTAMFDIGLDIAQEVVAELAKVNRDFTAHDLQTAPSTTMAPTPAAVIAGHGHEEKKKDPSMEQREAEERGASIQWAERFDLAQPNGPMSTQDADFQDLLSIFRAEMKEKEDIERARKAALGLLDENMLQEKEVKGLKKFLKKFCKDKKSKA